ncbi:079L [Invertebrate iridescent virus 6]|uniref:079L n=1 Tax=Invertebrate iridescent virus 6 TaxID=176652 RepID=Q91G31_IIV6|nr:079L [Invertebrate iridescent virus 6]AAK82001.1 079L [Invertebrate iridescent virus 6]QMS79644.1 hypothetical protein IIV6-T1_083 [Invertebrate iridescent virus 6]
MHLQHTKIKIKKLLNQFKINFVFQLQKGSNVLIIHVLIYIIILRLNIANTIINADLLYKLMMNYISKTIMANA